MVRKERLFLVACPIDLAKCEIVYPRSAPHGWPRSEPISVASRRSTPDLDVRICLSAQASPENTSTDFAGKPRRHPAPLREHPCAGRSSADQAPIVSGFAEQLPGERRLDVHTF